MSRSKEAAIAEQLDAGDYERAAAAIVRSYGDEVFGYLVALTRDADMADDVFAMTCEDLWRGLPGFRREASARTWLYKLAYNALQRRRSDPFRRRRAPLSRELSQLVVEVRSRTAPFLRSEVKDAVSQLRERLDPANQAMLILRVDRGLSWREVAEVMAGAGETLSEATLAKRFQRVKQRLRRLAVEAGLLPVDE